MEFAEIDTTFILDELLLFNNFTNNSTNQTSTAKVSQIAGGVGITVIINSVATVILLFVYIFLLQPCFTLYNVEKKQKLLDEINENKQENEKLNEDELSDIDDKSVIETASGCNNPILFFIVVRLLFIWDGVKSLLNPWYMLRERKRTIRRFGRDVAVYVFFQQTILYALFLCSMIGLAVLLPVHLTGNTPITLLETNDTNVSAPIVKSSIAMRLTQPELLSIHVILLGLFILIFTVFCVVWFLSDPLVSQINYMRADEVIPEMAPRPEDMIKLSEANYARPYRSRMNMLTYLNSGNRRVLLTSPYCVSISGIKSSIDQPGFVSLITQAAAEASTGDLTDQIAKIILVPSMRKRVEMQDQLKLLREYLENILYTQDRSGNEDPTFVTICCAKDIYDGGEKRHFKAKFEAIEYYQKHINLLEQDIAAWDKRYCEEYIAGNTLEETDTYKSLVVEKQVKKPKSSGFGFVVFRTTEAASKFLKSYASTGIKIVRGGKSNASGDIVLSVLPSVDEPEQPSEQLTSEPVETELEDIPVTSERTPPTSPIPRLRSIGSVVSKVTKQEHIGAVLDQTKQIASKVTEQADHITNEVKDKSITAIKNVNRLDILSFFSFRVEPLDYEPEDIDWLSMFDFNSKQKGVVRVLRQILIYFLCIVIFVIFSAPSAIFSGIQSVLKMGVIGVPVFWLQQVSGPLGDLVFQYLPTLFVTLTSSIVPIIIVNLTLLAQNKSYSLVQRRILWRSYAYLILSGLIVPSLLLTSIDALVTYFTVKGELLTVFGQLFLPSSGAFFINVIIQKALLGNSLALYRIGTFVFYLWDIRFTGKFWGYLRMRRYQTPTQKLRSAESSCLILEQEYATMHWILCTTLAFSVFSPIVLPCGLLYFIYKYFVDRSIMMDIYSHRRKNALFGAAFGFKTDFIAHQKMATVQCELMFINMFIFALYQTLFYASKVPNDHFFIPHTAVCAAVAGILLLLTFGVVFVMWLVRKFYILKHCYYLKNSKDGEQSPPELSSENVQKCFEVATSYPQIPLIPPKYFVPHSKEQLASDQVECAVPPLVTTEQQNETHFNPAIQEYSQELLSGEEKGVMQPSDVTSEDYNAV